MTIFYLMIKTEITEPLARPARIQHGVGAPLDSGRVPLRSDERHMASAHGA
jgi:hypothetical protein